MRRCVRTARRGAWWISCRRARSFMTCSATTSTRRSSMSCSEVAHRRRGSVGSVFHSFSSEFFRKHVMNDTVSAQSGNSSAGFKPKKSVALSGVPAGNTALCTVGTTGNDLHYRGYDILEIANTCEFEEIAYLLIYGKLPTRAELTSYKTKLKSLRRLPAIVRTALEALPAASHPMDVLRTGVSVLGCTLPEKDDHEIAGARDIADKLIASLGSMLAYWYHYSHNGQHIFVETEDDSVGGHFLHLLHRRAPSPSWVRSMHTSLILYA